MDNQNPNEMFPMVLHQISLKQFVCFEYTMPEPIFHRPDVCLHVIFHRFKQDKLVYYAWCYIKSIPLMRFVRSESFPCESSVLVPDAAETVVNHICNDTLLFDRLVMFLDWIEEIDYPKKLKTELYGSEMVERYDCFELSLPECLYDRTDINLQVVYRKSDSEKIRYNVWCNLEQYPLMEYIGDGELLCKDCDDVEQSIISQIDGNEKIYQSISGFLNLVETIEL